MSLTLKETNISIAHRRLKNPNWREADQLAIYKHDRGVAELWSTEKRLQLSGQSGTWTRELRISSPRPNHSATLPPTITNARNKNLLRVCHWQLNNVFFWDSPLNCHFLKRTAPLTTAFTANRFNSHTNSVFAHSCNRTFSLIIIKKFTSLFFTLILQLLNICTRYQCVFAASLSIFQLWFMGQS